MSRRSREKRVTLRGACEPVDNEGIERAFAELHGAKRQGGGGMDEAALCEEPSECEQVSRVYGGDVVPIDGVPSGAVA